MDHKVNIIIQVDRHTYFMPKPPTIMIQGHTASVYTGTCQRANTKEECETLANELGLSDTTASSSDNPTMPPGCYNKASSKNTKLWFNTLVNGNTSPCTDIRKCVCKNGLQPSFVPYSKME